MTDIPVIETESLIMRAPRIEDFESYAAYAASDRLAYIGGPVARYDAWRKFLAMRGHWSLFGYGFWMLENRATGQTMGTVGVLNNDGWPEPELGWGVYGHAEGTGIAHEAALAARTYAANHFGLSRLISQIHPDNARSRALAERMGATVERETTLLGDPCLIYRHPEQKGSPK